MLEKLIDALTASSFFQRIHKWSDLNLEYYARNSYWVVLKQIVIVATSLLFTVVFTHLSTQEVYGKYQFVLSILGVLAIFSLPGLNQSLTKYIGEGYDGVFEQATKTSFYWSFVGSFLLILGGSYYYLQDSILAFPVLLSSIFFPFLYSLKKWKYFLNAKGEFRILAKYQTIYSLMNLLFVSLVIYYSPQNLFLILCTYFTVQTSTNLLFTWKCKELKDNEKVTEDSKEYGYFLTATKIIPTVAAHIDKLLVGMFLSAQKLAIFSIGMLAVKKIQGFTKNLLTVTIPEHTKKKYISGKKYLLLFFGGLFISFVLFFAFEPLIPLLFTIQYKKSILVAQIGVAFFSFYPVLVLYKNQQVFTEAKNTLLYNSILNPSLKIILSVVLLYFFGIVGLAVSFGLQAPLELLLLKILDYQELL